ncbi:MAG: nucleotidyltransferase [Saprospiraceae bacterium]|nr:nucleotidyltransferase [Saprospiraceae bacterium]
MAGRGSRLRPHTLTIPKPLIQVAGKPIVQRLVEDLASSYGHPIEEVAFITGDFGQEVEKDLIRVAEEIGAKGTIYHQTQPLGTAHALLCAADSLDGNCILAFADTLFKADFSFNPNDDGVIWVQKVEDPSAYGVVKTDADGIITDFVEKSPVFISDQAIVGIYYIKDGAYLRSEMQYLIDNNIRDKGEYQLTNALENMKRKGTRFRAGHIEEWLDCGNKDALVFANRRVLEFNKHKKLISETSICDNSVIIQPCFIGENVKISNSVIGPFVSIGNNSVINKCVISNSIIAEKTKIHHVNMDESMIGNHVDLSGDVPVLSIGDFTKCKL